MHSARKTERTCRMGITRAAGLVARSNRRNDPGYGNCFCKSETPDSGWDNVRDRQGDRGWQSTFFSGYLWRGRGSRSRANGAAKLDKTPAVAPGILKVQYTRQAFARTMACPGLRENAF